MRNTIIFSFFLLPFCTPILAEEKNRCASYSDGDEIIDLTYHYINTKFCEPAIWFDSFFVDKRIIDDTRAGTLIRWTNDFSAVEYKGYRYKTKLTVRVHLPRVNRKLKLVFESDNEDDLRKIFPENTNSAENSFGLLYDWYAKKYSSFNVKITLSPKIEARYRYTAPFTEQTIGRLTQKIYQKKEITGEITQLDFDHAFNNNFVLRWTNFIRLETDVSGFEHGTGFTLYQFISEQQALSYQASFIARNHPNYYISNHHISITYRQNILRHWFFYELKPEINLYNNNDTSNKPEATITLRLEVLFQNI